MEAFCWNPVLAGSPAAWLAGAAALAKGFLGACVAFASPFASKGEPCLGWLLKELMAPPLAAKGFVLVGAELVAKGLNGDGRCVVWPEAENIWIDDATGAAIIYLIRGA